MGSRLRPGRKPVGSVLQYGGSWVLVFLSLGIRHVLQSEHIERILDNVETPKV